MDRPLWRIVLPILLLAFAVQRAGAAAIAWSAAPRVVAAAVAGEALLAVIAAIAIWAGARWSGAAILGLGIAIAASAALMVFLLGAAALPAAASRILVAALAAGAFFWVLRGELGGGADRPDAPAGRRDL
jgi:hypothetical protein